MKVEACSIGAIAQRVIGGSSTAVVMAVFERSFYLEIDEALVCVGEIGLQDGPINIRTSIGGTAHSCSSLGIRVGQRWTVDGHCFRQVEGGQLCIDVGSADTWRPILPRRLPERRQAAAGLAFLERQAAQHQPGDGLIRLAMDENAAPRNAVERAAFRSVRALRGECMGWLRNDISSIPDGMSDLIGLGPGLTPSGDDLICGFLIGCHHVGEGARAQDLWCRIKAHAEVATSPISRAHLAAAAEGQGAAALHQLLDAVIANHPGDMIETLDAVARIGHSSGWDATGGICLLLSGWLRADVDKRVAA